MKKKEYMAHFALALILFILVNVPTAILKDIRHHSLLSTALFAGFTMGDHEFDTMQLQIENNGLKQQIREIREWLKNQDRIETHLAKVGEWDKDEAYPAFYKRRVEDLDNLLKREVFGIEATVIFRDPAFWSSGVWVNKGERENRKWGRKIIQKNSPVVVGQALVGVVEEVEEERSYVRLITDASLTPAVRALRGGEQNSALLEEIATLEEQLKLREDLVAGDGLFSELHVLKEKLSSSKETNYLAKGELRGTALPLWRCRSALLKGIGFNYEFKDREGGPFEMHLQHSEALLKVGDLLVTSGLDGIFPEGLHVAIISKIYPLKEGAHSYEIEAKAALPSLNDITYVQILSTISS